MSSSSSMNSKASSRVSRRRLPGSIASGPDGRLRVQVFPTRGFFDPIAFKGFRANTWMQPDVSRENLHDNMARYYREGRPDQERDRELSRLVTSRADDTFRSGGRGRPG